MLTATFQGAQGVDGWEDMVNIAFAIPGVKTMVCSLLNSSGVQAAASLLASFGVPIATAQAKVASFCPAKTGTTPASGGGGSSGGGATSTTPTPGLSISTKLPTGTYPTGSAYTQSPVTGQFMIYVPFSGFGTPVVELGSICVDDWCGSLLSGGFGAAPQQVTPEQFVEILKKAGISTDQALALLGIVPWYKNWKYLVPMAVGVVAAGVGTYYIVRRKKEA